MSQTTHAQQDADRQAGAAQVRAKLDQAMQRLEKANRRRDQIQVKLEAARQQYGEASREAEQMVAKWCEDKKLVAQYPDLLTSERVVNLEFLRELYRRMEAENIAALAEFETAVDNYEKFIVRMETALADPEAMQALIASMPPTNKFDAILASAAPLAAVQQAAMTPGALPGPAVAFDEADI